MAIEPLEIVYADEALRVLRRLNKRELIRQKIRELAVDPDSLRGNVIRLQGRTDYRLRVQEWRVIFRIEDGKLLIDKILPRSSAYEVN
jgi:mRNA interferase RelE/StbE